MTKPKILWLSDSPITNTGYATISRNILNGISDEFECHYMGHNFVGQNFNPRGIKFNDGSELNFHIIGAGREAYCKDLIAPMINKIQPDFFIILLDTFMVYPWIMDFNFSPAKSIFYFPSDGGACLPLGCENVLKHMYHSIAMAKFGQEQAKQVHGINTDYIPHAVDVRNYFPVSDTEKKQYKQDYEVITVSGSKVKGALKDKFVVGCVSRNQGRKMLDRMIKSFPLFCKDKPDAVLLLHSDPYDGAAIFNIIELIKRYNLENRVFFSDIKFYSNFEYKDMNKVYNVMDVFFLPTSGEGFGVPIIEAMACEVPVVVTDFTTTKELVLDNGQCGYAAGLQTDLTGSWNVERGIMDIQHAAVCLNKLYNNKELRKQFGACGREKVIKYYNWDIVLKQWKSTLRRLLCQN